MGWPSFLAQIEDSTDQQHTITTDQRIRSRLEKLFNKNNGRSINELPTIGIIFALFFCSAWAGPPSWFKLKIAPSSNTPSPQITASDPGSKSFTETQIEDVTDYCPQTNGTDPVEQWLALPETGIPVADPTKFFLSGGGRKKGQLKGRKKIDGRPPSLPENNFLSGSAGGDTNKPNGNNTKEERGKSQHREA
uniref:Uncharacterized protein n=1 Tax=Globodera pallida TaxID=36090 RepID=A0A183BP44_GLOPA